jgi:thiamine biosynthesis lipoprotein
MSASVARIRSRAAVALLPGLFLFSAGSDTRAPLAAPADSRHEFEAKHMGTLARVVVYAPSRAAAEAGARAAFARIGELDARLSDYREDSELAALAREAGGPARPVSRDLSFVLARAQQLAADTGGAFDVTVGPLSRVWRAARRRNQLPDRDELESARAHVGYTSLLLDPAARRCQLARPGMRLDLGGIAKGYAADEALSVLKARRLPRALVVLGGDVAAGSPPPGVDGWTVAVEALQPQPPLLIRDAGVSTSGDAEQWLEANGVRYSHVLDPRTGQALVGRRSVTVVSEQAIDADALATALLVLGNERGRLFAEARATAAFFAHEAPTGMHLASSSRWAELARASR